MSRDRAMNVCFADGSTTLSPSIPLVLEGIKPRYGGFGDSGRCAAARMGFMVGSNSAGEVISEMFDDVAGHMIHRTTQGIMRGRCQYLTTSEYAEPPETEQVLMVSYP